LGLPKDHAQFWFTLFIAGTPGTGGTGGGPGSGGQGRLTLSEKLL
jgi:hypothetical protein